MSTQDQPGTPQIVAQRGIQPRHGELMQRCRQQLMNCLAEHLSGVFAQVDDTLFEHAEKAENNQLQGLFFDSMRAIRKQRPHIERHYHQYIAQQFSAFLDQRDSAHLAPAQELDAEQLSLIQNDEYEESLQVTNMVSRVKARCAQSLFTLEQRLALLNGGAALQENANPCGPHCVAQGFCEALAQTSLPLRIKVILYLLFDQHVMANLDALYSNLNQLLVDAGILPNLKFSPQRAAARHASSKASEPPSAAPPAAEPVSGNPPAGHASASGTAGGALPELMFASHPPSDPHLLFSGVSQLLHLRHAQLGSELLPGGQPSMASLAPHSATETYSADELLAALDRLQRQSAAELGQRLQQPQPTASLKRELQEQLAAFSQAPEQHKLAEQEADVIDLVGMLFDFILDDDNLPDSCKTALSHLHTPYLKIALQDKALFTQHQHPARRLLNSMAQAGVLYAGNDDEAGLLAKLQWTVEQVMQRFCGDLQLFHELQNEFNQFVATLQHKVELREKRAVEAIKGRDRLLGARQLAVEQITRIVTRQALPSIIRNFLELTWSDVLVFVLLRHGQDSHTWQRSLEVAEQLAWSGTPLDSDGQQRLQKLRLALLEDIRKGLELLGGYHEEGIRRLLQDLVACQHAIQAKQPQLADRLNPELPNSPLGAMLGEDAKLLEEQPSSGLTPRAQALIKELEQLEFGTWFEFSDGQQQRRLKLSWFSPTTRNYMFVDHSGQRVAIKPVTLLASELEQGLARIIAPERQSPLVDRALHAIYRVLQRFSGRNAPRQ